MEQYGQRKINDYALQLRINVIACSWKKYVSNNITVRKEEKKKRGGRTFFQEVTHRQKYSVSILMRRGSTHQHFSYLPKYL